MITIPELTTGQPTIPFFPDEPPPPPPPPVTPPVAGGLFGVPPAIADEIRRERRRQRQSRLGGRLFDIADEPFGAISVGLGFFVETERGEETIEQALGLPEEPLTRQERRARERLGRGRRQQRGFAEGFDFSDFFS